MDLNNLASFITSVGFPIVMCCALFWYMTKQNESHSEESKAMMNAINELKVAITTLTERLKKNDN